MKTTELLKALGTRQYVPVNGLSERIYYPLVIKGQALLVNIDDLGLCLTKPVYRPHPLLLIT